MKMAYSRYHLQLIGLFFLVSTLPVLALGMVAYVKTSDIAEDKAMQGIEEVLYQTHLRVEKELKTLEQMALHIGLSREVTETLRQPVTPRDFVVVRNIQKTLITLHSFEFGVLSTVLYSLDHNWLISNGASHGSFVQTEDILALPEVADYANLPTSSYWIHNVTRMKVDERLIDSVTLVKKIPSVAAWPSGLLTVSISAPEISRLLRSDTLLGDVVILDRDFLPVALSNHNPRSLEQLPGILEQHIPAAENGQGSFISKIDERQTGIVYRLSSYNGWIYVSLVPIEQIRIETRKIGWYAVYACSVMLLLAFIVSLFGSNLIYTPIRRLLSMFEKEYRPEAPLSEKHEIQSISRNITRLLSSHSQMGEQMHKQRQQLESFFAIRLLYGELKADEIHEKMSMFGYPGDWTIHYVLTLQIDSLQNTNYGEQDRDLLMFAVNNIVDELIPAAARLAPVALHQLQVTLVCGTTADPVEFKNDVYRMAENIQRHVREYLKLKISVGISLPFHRLRDASAAFRQGMDALKYQLALGQETILFYEDVHPFSRTAAPFPRHAAEELMDAIHATDEPAADLKLRRFIQEVFNDRRSHQEYQISLLRLLGELLQAVQDAGAEAETPLTDTESPSLLDQFAALKTTDQIEAWFSSQLIHPLIRLIRDRRASIGETISKQVIGFIAAEYDRSITLESCAARMNYHPVYVSRVFHREIGMTFADYLLRHRIGLAKRWLVETEMTITEIADKLNYHNVPNFIRSFRKVERMTPGQYRDEARKKFMKGYE